MSYDLNHRVTATCMFMFFFYCCRYAAQSNQANEQAYAEIPAIHANDDGLDTDC